MLLQNWVIDLIGDCGDLFPGLTWGEVSQDYPDTFKVYAWDDNGVIYLQAILESGDTLERVVSRLEKVWEVLASALDEYEVLQRGERISLSYNSSITYWRDHTGWRNSVEEIEEYLYDPAKDRHALIRWSHQAGEPYLDVWNEVEGPLEWREGLPEWKESNAGCKRWTGHPELTKVRNEADFMYPES